MYQTIQQAKGHLGTLLAEISRLRFPDNKLSKPKSSMNIVDYLVDLANYVRRDYGPEEAVRIARIASDLFDGKEDPSTNEISFEELRRLVFDFTRLQESEDGPMDGILEIKNYTIDTYLREIFPRK